MNYDVIIIGAGAAGLMAAISASELGKKVLVLESNDKAGLKICLLYTSPSPRDLYRSRMPSSA